MNDRFRFRAYNKELRKMYEVDTICPYEDNHTKGGEVFLKGIQYNSFYFPEEVEVMQCTGLKDKNGKLIYEGDIINIWCKNLTKNQISEVKFNEKRAAITFDYFTDYGNIVPCTMEKTEIVVIGNIYENKELLEDTECQSN